MQPGMPVQGLLRVTWRAVICHLLLGAPARERCAALGTAPGQRLEHARIGTRECVQRSGEVGAADLESPARRIRPISIGVCQARSAAANQRAASSPTAVLDSRIRARAEAQQRGVELAELRRDVLGRRTASPGACR